jgi:hypothetical protein
VLAIANWGATTWLNLMEESDIKEVSLNPFILKSTVEKSGMKYIHFCSATINLTDWQQLS